MCVTTGHKLLWPNISDVDQTAAVCSSHYSNLHVIHDLICSDTRKPFRKFQGLFEVILYCKLCRAGWFGRVVNGQTVIFNLILCAVRTWSKLSVGSLGRLT